jgi:hypothetical protein
MNVDIAFNGSAPTSPRYTSSGTTTARVGLPAGVRYSSVFADLFAPEPRPAAAELAATGRPPDPTGVSPPQAASQAEFDDRLAAMVDTYFVPRDPRFETPFILGDTPTDRPSLIFSDPLPFVIAERTPSRSRASELSEIQSPALTILFAGLVIASVLLFVSLVTPLLR